MESFEVRDCRFYSDSHAYGHNFSQSMIVMGFQYRIPLQSQREFHVSADAP